MRTATQTLRLNPLIIYTVALIIVLLWPFLLPGFLGLHDMVILDHPALTESAFGLGDTPARNAPQDGALALVGTIIPTGWFVRILMFTTAGLGAYLSTLWVQHNRHGSWHKAAAITLTLWNPFVIERLLQGHWSLVIAAWLLPGIAAVSRTRSKAALLALCSLTPTGLVLGLILALWTSTRKLHSYCTLFATGVFLSLPWLIPSLLNAPISFGTGAFVARAEGYVGTVGAIIGLGGIWNEAAVPPSRAMGFAVFGVLLFLLLARWMPLREGSLAILALALCLFLTFGPVEWITAEIPGAALFRDSQKLVILALPALVASASRIELSPPSEFPRVVRAIPPACVIALAILQVPDAPLVIRELKPHSTTAGWQKLEGKTLNADSTGLILFNDTVMVDPWTKATDTVAGGELTVDGQVIDPVSDAYAKAIEAWHNNDNQALQDQGINGVISNGEYHLIFAPSNDTTTLWWLGFFLSALWMIGSICLMLLALYSAQKITS